MAGDGQGGALDAGPGADLAVPADDAVHDAGVVLDLAVLEDNRLLDADAGADDDARANGDVGAELGGGVDVGARVDVDGGRMLAEGAASSSEPDCRALSRYRALAGTAEPAVLIWRQKSLVSRTKNWRESAMSDRTSCSRRMTRLALSSSSSSPW